MKFAVIRFHKSLDVSGLPQSNRFLLTAAEGFHLELEPTHGTGVIATHPNRPLPLWIPATDIASGDVLTWHEADDAHGLSDETAARHAKSSQHPASPAA